MSHDMLMRSTWWRAIVGASRQSPGTFAMFGAAVTALTVTLASAAQYGTNPSEKEALFTNESELLRRGGLDAKVLARANRERLRVLLEETHAKTGGDARYRVALNGESKGTHSTGTTTSRISRR